MTASSVLGILSGIKTVTRRLSMRWLKTRAGDRLWVRESWNYTRDLTEEERARQSEILRRFQAGEVKDIVKAALELPTGTGPQRAMYAADFGEWAHDPDSDLHWRSPMFMPYWASRISLEATEDARVERLREITEEDAVAEGVNASPDFTAVMNYAVLWNELHGKDAPWASNPAVVRIGFRRLP
jgi:hypothetical protein